MPIYVYACTNCGERTEAKQSFDDPPLEVCANCGGKLRKMYSPVGIVFKGSGFYSTDAKRSGASPSKTSSSDSGDSSTSTDSKKGDSSKGDSSKSGPSKSDSSSSTTKKEASN